MVVAPPSRHASGARYRWASGHGPDEHRLAPLPAWLDELAVALDRSGPEPRPSWFGRSDRPGPRQPADEARTPTERSEFARLWAEVGVDAPPGEVMVRCPFHDDHHPSLHVDGAGCRWFCFGCRRGGGVLALRRLVHPELSDRPARTTATSAPEAAGLAATTTLPAEVVVDVVGESAHQDALLALTGGRRTWAGAHHRTVARLVPDDDNPYDPHALAVVIGDHLVGHLPRRVARAYRPVVEHAISAHGEATCRAEVRGGWERPHGDVGRFGVVVWLPLPDDADADADAEAGGAPR
jgi:hypothetical protein